MPAVRNVLVVGAGAAGTADSHPARRGAASPSTSSTSSPTSARSAPGITLQGNALRVLRQLGVWDAGPASTATPSTPSACAHPTRTAPDRRARRRAAPAAPTCPPPSGMYRPDAGPRSCVDRAAAAGAKVRFGTTFTRRSQQDDAGVDVTFADGSTGRYDLVVGADGDPVVDPARSSASTWRPGAPAWASGGPSPRGRRVGHPHRPLLRRPLLHRRLLPDRRGHPLRLHRRGRAGPQRADARRSRSTVMRELSEAYHGPWDDIRDRLDRPVAGQLHLVRDATSSTRRGTAAASCSSATPRTPARRPSRRAPRRRSRTPPCSPSCCWPRDALDDDLWAAFTARRFDRAKTVVDASLQLGQWLLDHEQGDVPGLMARIAHLLSEPA